MKKIAFICLTFTSLFTLNTLGAFVEESDILAQLQPYNGKWGQVNNSSSHEPCQFLIQNISSQPGILIGIFPRGSKAAVIEIFEAQTEYYGGELNEDFDTFGKFHWGAKDKSKTGTLELYSNLPRAKADFLDINIVERTLKGSRRNRSGIEDLEYKTHRVSCRIKL